ncbi:hypothetical protein [Arenimonas aestuarii]
MSGNLKWPPSVPAIIFILLWLAISTWLASTVIYKRTDVERPSTEALIKVLDGLPYPSGALQAGPDAVTDKSSVVGAARKLRTSRSAESVLDHLYQELPVHGWTAIDSQEVMWKRREVRMCGNGISLFAGPASSSGGENLFDVSVYWAKLSHHSLYCPRQNKPQ